MRECGECDVCCRGFLTVQVNEIKVELNNPCPHVCNGCGIHDTRPEVCRAFQCAWKIEGWDDDQQPHKSGVITQHRRHNGKVLLLSSPTYEEIIPKDSFKYILDRCNDKDYGLVTSRRVANGSMLFGFNGIDIMEFEENG